VHLHTSDIVWVFGGCTAHRVLVVSLAECAVVLAAVNSAEKVWLPALNAILSKVSPLSTHVVNTHAYPPLLGQADIVLPSFNGTIANAAVVLTPGYLDLQLKLSPTELARNLAQELKQLHHDGGLLGAIACPAIPGAHQDGCI